MAHGRLSSGRPALTMLFVLTLPLVTPRIRGADEIEYFSYLHSVFFDHDLEFGNEYEHFYAQDPKGLAGFRATFLDKRDPVTGRHINFGPLGAALLWSPFYLATHLGVLLARGLGTRAVPDGFSLPYTASVCYASALYGFLGLLLIHDVLCRSGRFPEPAPTWAIVGLWLGSPLLYYMTLAPGFSHAASIFAVSLTLWLFFRALEREGPDLKESALIGAAGGLAALVREQDALFLCIPAAHVGLQCLRPRARGAGLARLLTLGAAAVLVFSPQLLVYRTLTGAFSPSHLVTRKMTYTSPHFWEVLFDPRHGLFLWTPLLLLAVGGLLLTTQRRGQEPALLLLSAFLLQVWINGSLESWTQAGAFGSRRFLSSLPVFAWGLAALLSAALPRLGRTPLLAAVALFVWWNVSLMIQFGLKLMDRQGLEWPRVAVNQVREVPPRLGRVAVLFFSDRERLVREGP